MKSEKNLTNLKEFETESSETVKIATVETEEFSTEEVFEKSSDPEEESEELEDGEIEEGSSDEEDEPISISIDEPKVEINGPSKPNEGVAIQYTEVLTCCPPTLRKLTEYLERRWCQRIRVRVIT